MFNEFSVVTTAVSSFNNAALFSPYFFVIGILSLPLFYITYLYGRDILMRLGWNNDSESKIGFWSVFCLLCWLLLFGGNYTVIRDGISLLPLTVSLVLFGSVIYVVRQAIKLNYLRFLQNRKTKWLTFFMLLLVTVSSAKPDLWGILLQLSAVVCGIIVGCRVHKNIPDITVTTLIFGGMTALILMQPEYFRFGQLGNLTMVHLLALLMTGFFAITALVARYTHARSKIYESAFVKLKWLCRILAVLALILFALTESVPVFIGLLVVVALSEMLTLYHSNKKSDSLAKQSWALVLFCFGVVIMCPVISCIGILYLAHLSENLKAKNFYGLL